MFPSMRRFAQQTAPAEAERMLAACDYGVLSLMGENGYPYGVPVNYVYANGRIYFHCAVEGHKLRALSKESRVCFTVVEKSGTVPAMLSTAYASVCVFGHAAVVRDEEERMDVLAAICARLAPGYPEEGRSSIANDGPRTVIVRVTPEHITGKTARQAVMERDQATPEK